MERLSHIDRLSDDLLSGILWRDDGSYERSHRNDSFDPFPYFPDENVYEPAPPPFSDPAQNLKIASVCQRWRCLVKRRVTSLFLKKNMVVSRQDLAAAVACFDNLTHVFLCDGSVETMDDAFLSDLAVMRPGLKALHVGRRITPTVTGKAKGEHAITEPGLESFLMKCNQLEQLSLYCLHKVAEYPSSFFQLKRLESLALSHASALTAPYFAAFSSLSCLHLTVPRITFQQLSCLTHVQSLSSLFISAEFSPSKFDQVPAVFPMSRLPLLKTLEFGVSGPNINLVFPAGSPCTNLEQLLISRCSNFRSLPDDIEELLPCLRKLTILRCQNFIQLPETFTSLVRLEELSIHSSALASLPNDFGWLPALKRLSLRNLSLSHLPTSLGQLQFLTALVVINCHRLRQLPADLCNLSSLRTLDLKSYHRLELPLTLLVQLSSLTTLELGLSDGFHELPEDMGRLTNLRHLYLDSCLMLRKVPDSVTSLSSLETMVIRDCQRLSAMPRRLGSLEKLKRLEVTRCFELTEQHLTLPVGLKDFEWRNSREFGLLHNTSLPSSLCCLVLELAGEVEDLSTPLASLSQLRVLSIYNARRFTVPALQQLRQLEILAAARLMELPETISQLQQLTSLKVCSPVLTTLPNGLGALTRLRQLDLSGCSVLQQLPCSLTQLGCLYDLNLSDTSISSLPPMFGRLGRLRSLNLYGCKPLRALPEDLPELKVLQQLDTRGCKQLRDSMSRALRHSLREMNGLTMRKFW